MTPATQIDTQMTPSAEAFIRRLYRFAAGPQAGFQLKVAKGGCSGFATEFDLVGSPDAGDYVWEHNGMRIFLNAQSRILLDGATVDFRESLSQAGFHITTEAGAPAACGSASNMVSVASLVGR